MIAISVIAPVFVQGCSSTPRPPDAIAQGYAARLHQGVNAAPESSKHQAPNGIRANVELVVHDSYAAGPSASPTLRATQQIGFSTINHINLPSVPLQAPPDPHGWNVLSVAVRPLLDAGVEDYVRVSLVRWIDAQEDDRTALLKHLRATARASAGRVVANWSWGMPRGVLSDEESDATWREFSSQVETFLEENPSAIIVMAAGNEGPFAKAGWPQSLIPSSVLVGSTDKNGHVSEFTTYSENLVCTALGHDRYVMNPNGGWKLASGTSFAAPAVAGLATLYLVENPDGTRAEFTERLMTWLERPDELSEFNVVYGFGDSANHSRSMITKETDRRMGVPNRMGRILSFSFFRNGFVPLPQPTLGR